MQLRTLPYRKLKVTRWLIQQLPHVNHVQWWCINVYIFMTHISGFIHFVLGQKLKNSEEIQPDMVWSCFWEPNKAASPWAHHESTIVNYNGPGWRASAKFHLHRQNPSETCWPVYGQLNTITAHQVFHYTQYTGLPYEHGDKKKSAKNIG